MLYEDMKKCCEIIKLWNKKKSFTNFKNLYKYTFFNNVWFGYRLFKIFYNTISGKYKRCIKEIEERYNLTN